jgi:tRNA 2-thiocytidine biosynthesis protein TtcA
VEIIFNALQNVSPSHLLDRKIFDFEKLESLIGEKDQTNNPLEELLK